MNEYNFKNLTHLIGCFKYKAYSNIKSTQFLYILKKILLKKKLQVLLIIIILLILDIYVTFIFVLRKL